MTDSAVQTSCWAAYVWAVGFVASPRHVDAVDHRQADAVEGDDARQHHRVGVRRADADDDVADERERDQPAAVLDDVGRHLVLGADARRARRSRHRRSAPRSARTARPRAACAARTRSASAGRAVGAAALMACPPVVGVAPEHSAGRRAPVAGGVVVPAGAIGAVVGPGACGGAAGRLAAGARLPPPVALACRLAGRAGWLVASVGSAASRVGDVVGSAPAGRLVGARSANPWSFATIARASARSSASMPSDDLAAPVGRQLAQREVLRLVDVVQG